MCEIKAKIILDGHPLVFCTKSDDDFLLAKSIRLFDEIGNAVDITKFAITETRQCFNNNPISPVFRIDENVSDNFLKVGNRVEFSRKVIPSNKPSRPVRPSVPRNRRELAYA